VLPSHPSLRDDVRMVAEVLVGVPRLHEPSYKQITKTHSGKSIILMCLHSHDIPNLVGTKYQK
jgi:hypothetical protein